MVLDTSAVLAILMNEEERRSFTLAIESADACCLSVASFVEVSIILESRHGAEGVRAFDRFLAVAGIELISVDARQAEAAREAFRQFGKDRHAAGLNFGDCFSYALARIKDAPLLFKGKDFSMTDVLLPA